MCALVGIISSAIASAMAVEGLYIQQHRGREAAGVASSDGMGVHLRGGLGIVGDVFPSGVNILEELPGQFAIGQNRYGTVSREEDERNALFYQPVRGHYGNESFALAHNGNITNTEELWPLVDAGRAKSSVDTELIVLLIEKFHTGDLETDLKNVLCLLQGSYCLLILFRDRLIAIRDPSGNRPLSLGKGAGELIVVASETCVFETFGVRDAGDVEPGTYISFIYDGTSTITRFAPKDTLEHLCIFEEVYFKLPMSRGINQFRIRLGQALEELHPVPGADLVIGVPDSAVALAVGYGRSGRSGYYCPSMIRHHYAGGRTFILPDPNERKAAVRRKFIISVSDLEGEDCAGKKIVLVDDSLVRGTTMEVIVGRLRKAGAREVHVRSAFPPIRHPCVYGIDTPTEEELIAPHKTVEEIRKIIGADSLAFSDLDTLLRVVGGPKKRWCTACIDGKYWH